MCGIVAALASPEEEASLRRKVLKASRSIRHRGPDWSGLHVQLVGENGNRRNMLAHERLGIVAPQDGAQPLMNESGGLALTVNGEIYNHAVLREELSTKHNFKTASDCEVILHLYEEQGAAAVKRLDGVFAFVLADADSDHVLAARDPIGVVPLYWGRDAMGAVWFASEMKALADVCTSFEPFPPGHYYYDGDVHRYYDPEWREVEAATQDFDPAELRNVLERAIVKRLMSDVPYGVLLSGGLDSSVVAAVAARHAERRVEDHEKTPAWWPRLHSFCIGLEGSPDLAAAEKVAAHIETVHHSLTFTLQDGLDALPEVIRHLETYDITTIRASTPMFLMSRQIKAMGIKMVLSGEGSDEIFGGYLYFHKAPNGRELHEECVRKVEKLHYYDCLRANKSTSAWGVEARVPFLDQEVLDYVMTLDPQNKMCDLADGRMEKHILRQAFDVEAEPYLPESVLWRQKEQFSDGVGYGWIDALRDAAEKRVSDQDFELREHRFPVNPPLTKEGYLYRKIFEECYPQSSAATCVDFERSIACSSETALRWDAAWEATADPSGRAIASHDQAWEG
jgi:asparagine synthase (glutamine-hydrolysing)